MERWTVPQLKSKIGENKGVETSTDRADWIQVILGEGGDYGHRKWCDGHCRPKRLR